MKSRDGVDTRVLWVSPRKARKHLSFNNNISRDRQAQEECQGACILGALGTALPAGMLH